MLQVYQSVSTLPSRGPGDIAQSLKGLLCKRGGGSLLGSLHQCKMQDIWMPMQDIKCAFVTSA